MCLSFWRKGNRIGMSCISTAIKGHLAKQIPKQHLLETQKLKLRERPDDFELPMTQKEIFTKHNYYTFQNFSILSLLISKV